MAFLSNLHTHTTYSDGENSPEEYVLAAIEKGFVSLGFSEHAPDPCYGGLAVGRIPEYRAEIERLRRKYAGRIELYAGLETDYYSPRGDWELDYTIGSVHYLETTGDRFLSVDYRHESIQELIEHYGGARGMAEEYYRLVRRVVTEQRPAILGHIDLITKLNAGNRYFDPDALWHRAAAGEAIRAAAECGCIVEINTGAISRGYTSAPYPGEALLRQFFELGGSVTISSDAHSAATLDAAFDVAIELARRVGYRSVKQLRGGEFVDAGI